MTMKHLLLFLQLFIFFASYVYCVLPPHLLDDHCYELDPDFSFMQENNASIQINQICFDKDKKLYEIASRNFVAWHVTIMSMAKERVNFRAWKVSDLNLFVNCKFATIDEALDFHREIYDDRMYDVPREFEQAEEWQQIPEYLTKNLPIPFQMQKSNDILAVAMVAQRSNPDDPLIAPTILAKPSDTARLFYENYYQRRNTGEFMKIFTITVGETTNVNKPVAIFAPEGFDLAKKLVCGDFIVISVFQVYYIMSLATNTLRDDLYDTLAYFTQYNMNCPEEVDHYFDELTAEMYV